MDIISGSGPRLVCVTPAVGLDVALPLLLGARGLDPGTQRCSLSHGLHPKSKCEQALGRSRLMYDVRAYWHWFADHGLEDTDMLGAIETTQSIIDEYADAER